MISKLFIVLVVVVEKRLGRLVVDLTVVPDIDIVEAAGLFAGLIDGDNVNEKTGRFGAVIGFAETVVIVNDVVGVVELFVVVFLVQALANIQRLGLFVVGSNGSSSNTAVVKADPPGGRGVVTIELDE